MEYRDMAFWAKDYEMLLNRISIGNQLLGYGVDGRMDNPLRLSYGRGSYSVSFCGDVVETFSVWDLDGLRSALSKVDAWSDCLWRVRRAGFLSPVIV